MNALTQIWSENNIRTHAKRARPRSDEIHLENKYDSSDNIERLYIYNSPMFVLQ